MRAYVHDVTTAIDFDEQWRSWEDKSTQNSNTEVSFRLAENMLSIISELETLSIRNIPSIIGTIQSALTHT